MPTVQALSYLGNSIFDVDSFILLKNPMNTKIMAVSGTTELFKSDYNFSFKPKGLLCHISDCSISLISDQITCACDNSTLAVQCGGDEKNAPDGG